MPFLSDKTGIARRTKALKGFQKVSLAAGQSQQVRFSLNASVLSYWDTTAHNWVVPQGTFSLQVGDSSRNLPLHGTYQVTTPSYNALAQAFNNVGTSDNSNPSVGNFDGSGYSYSAQALASVGLTPGAVVSHNGILFTWPNVAAGQQDNVQATGQTIPLSASGSVLAFLGTGAFGSQSGTGTVTYTDGSTQTFTLALADWYANAPVAGSEIAVTTTGWNVPTGDTLGNHSVNVYYMAVGLTAGKTVSSVTLPNNSNLHLFALTVQ